MPARIDMLRQPDNSTCGPTCLHAVYSYYGETWPLDRVIAETPSLDEGGTLAVMLGCHALEHGYRATLYSYNLTVLDPTWFLRPGIDLASKLRSQAERKTDPKLAIACRAYLEFLRLGGELRMDDLNLDLLRTHLDAHQPLLAGVSATYLYGCARELSNGDYDDIGGFPSGHFVVLADWSNAPKAVRVYDPWQRDPVRDRHSYWVDIHRLVNAIMLGVLTYDGNILVIEPKERST